MLSYKNKKSFLKNKYFLYILGAIIVAGITVLVLELTHKIDIYHKKPTASHASQTSSSTNSGSSQQGGVVDKSGATTDTTVNTNQNQWVISKSKAITLQQPIDGVTLKSGDTIRGTSTIESVQYRLEDDRMGVIAQGSLSVVDGKFSGILQFRSQGTTGTLDIFTFDSQSGAEINHADINVKFQE